jgi:hypothetical protein
MQARLKTKKQGKRTGVLEKALQVRVKKAYADQNEKRDSQIAFFCCLFHKTNIFREKTA